MKFTTTATAGAKSLMLIKDTQFSEGGPVAKQLLLTATVDIEGLCQELQNQIVDMDTDTDTMAPCLLMRAMCDRIYSLNSVLMSYASEEDGFDLRQASLGIYGRGPAERVLAAMLGDDATTAEFDFMAGRDLAVQMLKKSLAISPGEGDICELDGTFRTGKPQLNFALEFLEDLIKAPERLHGFAAVLSSSLGPNGSVSDAENYATLPYARMTVTEQERAPESLDVMPLKAALKRSTKAASRPFANA